MNSYNDVQRTLGDGDRAAAQVLYGGMGVALRSLNSQYFYAEGSGESEVVTNHDWIGSWETFNFCI